MSYLSTSSPIVISFYTINTPYQLEVLNLIQSCEMFGIDACIEAKESQGSWELNCALKPAFIRDKLYELKRPVFWIDADAAFKQKPDFAPFLNFDVGVREMSYFADIPYFKLFAGSLFFNYTEKALSFVDEWCQLCEQKRKENPLNLLFLDQRGLLAVKQKRSDVQIINLPIAYSKVFDFSWEEVRQEELVVEHYQASRRFKKLI